MIKQLLKIIGKRLGYDIELNVHGSTPIQKPVSLTLSNSLIVEFVGPPGVGKTTLMNKVLEINKHESPDYISMENYASALQRKYKKPKRLNRLYELLLDRKIRRIESREFAPLTKIQQLNHASKVAIWDNYIHLKDEDKVILADEGLVYCFIDSLVELGKDKPTEFRKIMDHRAVIFCKDKLNTIVKRIRNRQENGVLRDRHWGLMNDEILLQTKNEIEREERLIEVLENYMVPYMTVDGSEPLAKNAQKIDKFIASIDAHN